MKATRVTKGETDGVWNMGMKAFWKKMNQPGACIFTVPIKEEINLDLLNILASGENEHLLTCTYKSTQVSHEFSYSSFGESIEKYLLTPSTNSTCFLHTALLALDEIDAAGFPIENLVITPSSVYVSDGEPMFVLIPVTRSLGLTPQKAFEALAKMCKLSKNIKRQALKACRTRHADSSTFKTIADALIPIQQGSFCEGVNPVSNESETTLLGCTEAADFTEDACETTFLDVENPHTSNESQTTLLTPNDSCLDDVESGLLDSADDARRVEAYLVRCKTGEKIPICTSPFVIGKSAGEVDYAVDEADCISRRHVSIVMEDKGCFIIDNHSTNQTFVEGTAITALEKVELEDGTLFTLGDENFQIYMETR